MSQTLRKTKSVYEEGRFFGGAFVNPWDTWEDCTISRTLQWKVLTLDNSNVPWKKPDELDIHLPIEKPDFKTNPEDKITVTWIGHATVLVNMDGYNIMTDPIFSERCTPLPNVGPQRFRNPPCTIEELPEIHAVLISHNHYDHLDKPTVIELLESKSGPKIRWFVPKKMRSWFEEIGAESLNITELDWWDECRQQLPGFTFILTPAQHWSGRSYVSDYNAVLWGSWVVKGPTKRFYFAGDTGYCSAFREIGAAYGPFDLAAIPIGAYEPRWIMEHQHVDPEDAVRIHLDIRSKQSIGIHWGTFALAHEHYLEPPQKLKEALEELKVPPKEFITLHHGRTKSFPLDPEEEEEEENKEAEEREKEEEEEKDKSKDKGKGKSKKKNKGDKKEEQE